VQPKHWDYCGWFWWPQQKRFVGVPGQLGDTTQQAPGETSAKIDDPNFIRDDVMTFDPALRMQPGAWQTFGSGIDWQHYGWDSWFVIFDEQNQTVTRFGVGGPGVSQLNLTTKTWGPYYNLPLDPNGQSISIWKEYYANDPVGRRTFMLDAINGHTYRYDWNGALSVVAPFPGPLENPPATNHTHLVWNEKWRVVEYLSLIDDHFYWFDPDGLYGAANTWHDAGMAASEPAGLYVQCRVACRDPANDVSIWFGGVEVPNPYLFAFRFRPPGVGPAWLSGKAVNQWIEIPNTKQTDADLSAIIAAGVNNVGVFGNMYSGLFAFSGGALRQATCELIIRGGGGTSWAGNEGRVLNLLDDAPHWKVKIPPTKAADMWSNSKAGYVNPLHPATERNPYYYDGRPAIGHMYYSQMFLDGADKFISVGRTYFWPLDQGGLRVIDEYGWGAGTWSPPKGVADAFYPGPYAFNFAGPWLCKNPLTEELYYCITESQVGRYKDGVGWGPILATVGATDFDVGPAATDGNVILHIGPYQGALSFSIITIATGAVQVIPSPIAVANADGCALVFDERLRCFTFFQDDGLLYDIAPGTWTVTQKPTVGMPPIPGGAAQNGGGRGIYNRMQYVRALRGIVLSQTWDANTYFIQTAP
jgi:hypothetical protein